MTQLTTRTRLVPQLRTRHAERGFLVAWTCWGRPDMVPLIMDAWKASYRPEDASLLFLFDTPEDDGVAKYWERRVLSMPDYHFFTPFVNHGPECHENALHNVALRTFLQNPQREFSPKLRSGFHTLIVWQDDQQVVGSHLLADVERLRVEYPKLGVVGGRDGFDHGYADMRSAPHSASPNGYKIKVGEFVPKPLLNRGPVIYPYAVADRVGLVDTESFPTWFGEVDYAARAHEKGFTNGVLGVDCVHQTFGRTTASSWHYGEDHKEVVEKQRQRLRERHPELHAC